MRTAVNTAGDDANSRENTRGTGDGRKPVMFSSQKFSRFPVASNFWSHV